jgi:cytochrome c1
MTRARTVALTALTVALIGPAAAVLADELEAPPPPRVPWSFSGPLGKNDQGQLQRGFRLTYAAVSLIPSLDAIDRKHAATVVSSTILLMEIRRSGSARGEIHYARDESALVPFLGRRVGVQ